jgi:uncharacterized protein
MAIDSTLLIDGTRRTMLLGGAAGLTMFCGRAAGRPVQQETLLAAAWTDGQGQHIGLLQPRRLPTGIKTPAGSDESTFRLAGMLDIATSLEVPTRAHGLWAEQGGCLLAIARRPGDWMLRWRPGEGGVQWMWSEAGRSFNGHVVAGQDYFPRPWLYTTETDLETGRGLVGVRDARSLSKLKEWPTHGMDPHELLLDDRGLWVANGGIPTQPETGRIKRDLHRMDSSLVCLDPLSGQLRGQWRLSDPRLSLRHIARIAEGLLGVALQAEHDDLEARLAAPVLAVFDGETLSAEPLPADMAVQGYGGDIAALPGEVAVGGGFLVSAPRAHCVLHWNARRNWQKWAHLDQACALAEGSSRVWSLGQDAAFSSQFSSALHAIHWSLPGSVRLDNHAVTMLSP